MPKSRRGIQLRRNQASKKDHSRFKGYQGQDLQNPRSKKSTPTRVLKPSSRKKEDLKIQERLLIKLSLINLSRSKSSINIKIKEEESINFSSKSMTISDNNKMSFCKESNKLVGTANYLAWNKRTILNLIENEVMDHIKGSIMQPPKDDTQAHARFMKGEVRARRILIESIKDSLIPYVSKLETTKDIYDKLVELFSVSTTGQVISLRQELYKLKMSKEDGIASYFTRILEIRDQLQELEEVMSNREMTTMVPNALS